MKDKHSQATDDTPAPQKNSAETAGAAAEGVSPPDAVVASKQASPARPSVKNTWVNKLVFGLLLLVLFAGAAGGYYGWHWQQKQEAAREGLEQRLVAQDQALQRLRGELEDRLGDERAAAEQLRRTLAALEQRLDSHNKRLLSLSTTDRDDWRLAEAEYLLQLANQRLVIEKDSRNAEALLSSADRILRDLGDIDLFPVRQGLNRDLTALKLADKVDREGVFLRLSALSGQIDSLPLMPVPQIPAAQKRSDAGQNASQQSQSWGERIKSSFVNALQKAKGYINVYRHEQPLQPLLPPDSRLYLQQNLRFMLEQAQLALLREEKKIYRQSLQQARDWLARYYPPTGQAATFDAELAALQRHPVVQELPDISGSLEQLQAYIERLHKLDEVSPVNEARPEREQGAENAREPSP